MYYEEKYENGLWYWRGTPDGAWERMGLYLLGEKFAAAQKELAAWRKAVEERTEEMCCGNCREGDKGEPVCCANPTTIAEITRDRVSELLAQEGGK